MFCFFILDIDIQTDNNLTEEMYEEKYNISHELQRNSFQETDFSETYILEKKQEVHSAGSVKKENNVIDGMVKDSTSPMEECFFSQNPNLNQCHTISTGEQPPECTGREKAFSLDTKLIQQEIINSGERPFNVKN